MEFNRYPIRVPAKSQVMLKEDDLKDHVIQTRDLKFIRGHFIDLMVEIEERINLLIEKSFIPKNSKLREVFNKNFINSKNFGLKNKADLLKDIISSKNELKKEDYEILYNFLIVLIDERNRWAHGSMFFQQEKQNKKLKLQSYLSYINSKGEKKEIKLTNTYFDSLNEKLTKINERLIKVMKKRKLIS